jgi:hypothetical protein
MYARGSDRASQVGPYEAIGGRWAT